VLKLDPTGSNWPIFSIRFEDALAAHDRWGHFDGKTPKPQPAGMEVHLNPDLEKKLNDLAAKTGRRTDELVEDVMTGYLNEFVEVRGLLDSRYDDLKGGRVKLIDGEEAFARMREKSKRRRDGST